jgi:hypothetical protein
MSQQSLDRIVIFGKLEEIRKIVDELRERVMKVESDLGVLETGSHLIYGALEAAGLMRDGEPVPKTETQKIEKEPTAAVSETTFTILKWDPQQGAKIGPYDVAYKPNNLDKWNSAYNILHASNATIKARYYGQGYQFSYWLWGEGKIYRQKLKAKTEASP